MHNTLETIQIDLLANVTGGQSQEGDQSCSGTFVLGSCNRSVKTDVNNGTQVNPKIEVSPLPAGEAT